MEFKDYYATLGIPKTAVAKEIKTAYRKLARKFHPDVNPGDKKAESRFKEINEAYEVLGDPDKRRKYDELGANWRMYEQQQAQAGSGGQPSGGPGGWQVNVGGPSGGGFRTITEDEMHRIFGDEDPFSDFFKTFFGGGDPGTTRHDHQAWRWRTRFPVAHRPGILEHEIELSLEDALNGTTQRLAIQQDDGVRTVDVRIPMGVSDGSRVRVGGEGEQVPGGKPGDFYLRVKLIPHAGFERRGQDLYTHVGVPIVAAVLGGEAEVTTLGGSRLRLKIPPGTQNGQVFRLKGHGMPAVGKPDQRGDLYVTVDVQVPRDLTPEQRQHYEALATLEKARK